MSGCAAVTARSIRLGNGLPVGDGGSHITHNHLKPDWPKHPAQAAGRWEGDRQVTRKVIAIANTNDLCTHPAFLGSALHSSPRAYKLCG